MQSSPRTQTSRETGSGCREDVGRGSLGWWVLLLRTGATMEEDRMSPTLGATTVRGLGEEKKREIMSLAWLGYFVSEMWGGCSEYVHDFIESAELASWRTGT